jgi:hypothetical protein
VGSPPQESTGREVFAPLSTSEAVASLQSLLGSEWLKNSAGIRDVGEVWGKSVIGKKKKVSPVFRTETVVFMEGPDLRNSACEVSISACC